MVLYPPTSSTLCSELLRVVPRLHGKWCVRGVKAACDTCPMPLKGDGLFGFNPGRDLFAERGE